MTKGDFEKTDDYSLMLFVGENYQKMVAKFIDNGRDFVCTHDDVQIEPIKWFQLLVIYFGYTAEKIKGEPNKITFLAQARSNCVQLVYNLERMLAGVSWTKKYDLRGFIVQVDALIELGKTEVEAQLLVSQLAANESAVYTNQHLKDNNDFLKTIFKVTLILTIGGMIISAWSLWYASETNEREREKESREAKQSTSDSLFQLMRSENYLLKSENASLKTEVDSLKKKVNSKRG